MTDIVERLSKNRTVLYWHETGPKISYGHDILVVEDLNPEQRIAFVMTAQEMRDLAYDILRNVGHTIDPWAGIPKHEGFDGPQGAN